MTESNTPLSLFHPLIGSWFSERMGMPTEVQSRAWPVIAGGAHALLCAPTGSGKTLAAFLWAIDRLAAGAWPAGKTRVLYVSPLKALNNDVRRNLITPLMQIKERFTIEGKTFPEVRVLTRSGDTPAQERRLMLRRPPEILITTPESLNILLSSQTGRSMLTGVATVILDEIHAIAGGKRGTHCITAVERLTLLAGEFQRIALSATVRPLEEIARFVGGRMVEGTVPGISYRSRPVSIIQSREEKRYDLRVHCPDPFQADADGSRWPSLIASFKEIIAAHRSTLFFTNSRRNAERITRLINENEEKELAYSHHGSLSREIRLAVEERLKRGELRAIVATSSLELGIDIGELDAVTLVQTPRSVSSALQRIGRAGHGVGETSRGMLYPTHGTDFLAGAVMARCVAGRDIEAIAPVECPLDVLAQLIVSMTGVERWNIDELYAFIKTAHPYRDLPRAQFDLTMEMLAGRYAGSRMRELSPRLSIDRLENTAHAREGMLRLIYLSGGTIPDRGYFDLRVEGSRAKIGELDEEFVWERTPGETFTLGAQVWRITRVTHNDVEVSPAEARPGIFPFWKAEEQHRDFHFSEKIAAFLERAEARLDDTDFTAELQESYFMDDAAAAELIAFLKRQREATKSGLPHRHHLLIEHFDDPANAAGKKQVILHTLWGGRINRPLALALSAAWKRKYAYNLETTITDDCVMLMLPHEFSARELFALVTPETIEELLRLDLEATGFFGARFRENAGRALLLPRAGFGKRLPLWLNRLRAKKLMNAVLPYPDFPILLETWRTCLRDEFDLENLRILLEELRAGEIQISETITPAASPFAGNLVWKQTNTYMYEDDTPVSGVRSGLTESLLKELVSGTRLRPRIPESLASMLGAKLTRTAQGYAPRSSEELLDWLKERLLIPNAEWRELLEAIARDQAEDRGDIVAPIAEKIAAFTLPGANNPCVCAIESLPAILQAFGIERGKAILSAAHPGGASRNQILAALHSLDALKPAGAENSSERDDFTLPDLLTQWLSFYGPVERGYVLEALGIDQALLDETLGALAGEGRIILDELRENASGIEICDSENLEILLRMARRARRPAFRALPIEKLPLFIAAHQELVSPGNTVEDMQRHLDRLFGFPASAAAWEEYILPARLSPYYGSWLDGLMHENELVWFGCGKKKSSFAFHDDLELFRDSSSDEQSSSEAFLKELAALLPDIRSRYGFFDIVKHSSLESDRAAERLWALAWKGLVSCDSYTALRRGILGRFTPAPLERPLSRRSGMSRWAGSRPSTGNWYALTPEYRERDAVEGEELSRDRVRQLLRRYGILFRELLAAELPPLQWGTLFRTLRLMELSGEILAGYFFEGIPGAQFISHEAFRLLQNGLPGDAPYWMNAADPASLCGVRLDGLKGMLPARLPVNWISFRGEKPVVIANRNGKSLEILAPPGSPFLSEALSFFKTMLTRDFNPMRAAIVEEINGVRARDSEHAPALLDFGFKKSYKGLELLRRY